MSADAPGRILFETDLLRIKRGPHGLVCYPVHDEFVGRSLDLYGEWSAGDAEVVAPYLRPGMTALDVGANLGSFTLFLAQAVGRTGRVHAFEPVAATHGLLRCNLALNALAQVQAHEVAVGSGPGRVAVPEIDLSRPGNFGAAALCEATAGGRRVERIALDDLDLPACDLIKADVEGHELDVLRGAERLLGRARPVLLLENEEPSLSAPLISALHGLGYRLWWHAPPLFRRDNPFGCREDCFPGLGSLNLLCLPAERSDAPRGLVPVRSSSDWPSWWPDWSARPAAEPATRFDLR